MVGDAVRATFGLPPEAMDDDEAIDRVMNPARNLYRVDMLNVSHHSPMMRALHHPSYVFEKKLSHTADSQDQRHRMVPASRPLMTFADTSAPDVVTPRLIRENARALRGLPAGDGRRLDGEEPAARLGRAARVRALRAAQRQGAAPGRVGQLPGPAAQVDAAHLLQRAGGDLPGVDGRDRPGPRPPSAAGGASSGRPVSCATSVVSPRCTEGSHFCGVPVWNSFPAAVRRL